MPVAELEQRTTYSGVLSLLLHTDSECAVEAGALDHHIIELLTIKSLYTFC